MRAKKVVPAVRTVVSAVYSPTIPSKAICPRCFSYPSLLGRMIESSKVYNTDNPWMWRNENKVVDGVSYSAGAMNYPCSNINCFTAIVVYTSNTLVPGPWKEKEALVGSGAIDYLEGSHTKEGVWVDADFRARFPDPAPAEPTPVAAGRAVPSATASASTSRREPMPSAKAPPRVEDMTPDGLTVTFEGPWMYIDYKAFELAYPPAWTRDSKGRLKVRVGTDREKIVRKFFKTRSVSLPEN